jgi:hypothetical protein
MRGRAFVGQPVPMGPLKGGGCMARSERGPGECLIGEDCANYDPVELRAGPPAYPGPLALDDVWTVALPLADSSGLAAIRSLRLRSRWANRCQSARSASFVAADPAASQGADGDSPPVIAISWWIPRYAGPAVALGRERPGRQRFSPARYVSVHIRALSEVERGVQAFALATGAAPSVSAADGSSIWCSRSPSRCQSRRSSSSVAGCSSWKCSRIADR